VCVCVVCVCVWCVCGVCVCVCVPKSGRSRREACVMQIKRNGFCTKSTSVAGRGGSAF